MVSWDSLYHLYNARDPKLSLLKQKIISILYLELKNVSTFLETIRNYNVEKESRIQALAHVEERLCDVLICLIIITENRERESLPYEDYLPLLLKLLKYISLLIIYIFFSYSSCRGRRLICRVFRQLLPYTTPQAVHKLLQLNNITLPQYTSPNHQSNLLFLFLMDQIWNTLSEPNKIYDDISKSMTSNRYNITNPCGYGCGLSIRSYRCELVYLFRHLLLVYIYIINNNIYYRLQDGDLF